MFLGVAYLTCQCTALFIISDALWALSLMPLAIGTGLALYFAKPESWIRVDRLTNQLELRRARISAASSPPHIVVPVAAVRDVVAQPRSASGGRGTFSHALFLHTLDGQALQLTPSFDLSGAHAQLEASKMMNAVRVARNEPVVIAF